MIAASSWFFAIELANRPIENVAEAQEQEPEVARDAAEAVILPRTLMRSWHVQGPGPGGSRNVSAARNLPTMIWLSRTGEVVVGNGSPVECVALSAIGSGTTRRMPGEHPTPLEW